MKTVKRFKFLRTGYKSEHVNHKWQLNKWYTYEGGLKLCESGFHCSKGIYQAFSYVQGEYLAEVEVKGKSKKETDKEVWEKMRVTKVWKWQKKDSILFSIYAARLVLKIFEDKYPNDDRPRKAIEAAEAYAKNPTEANRQAAAWAAARAAEVAARAAEAVEAAWAAARAAICKKLDAWMLKHLKELKRVK